MLNRTVFIMIIFMVSCTQIDSPPDVTEKFWNAMENKDTEEARKYALPGELDSYSTEDMPNVELVAVSDEAEIQNDKARVGTEIKMNTDENVRIYKFDTVLAELDNKWKVDYDRTVNSMMMSSVKQFGDELKQMGREMGKALGEAMKEMGEAMEDAFKDAKEKLDRGDNNTGN